MPRESSESRQRRADQTSRQARVGILRNPNSPPPVPPRRAQLMGKWPSLRSSRRPQAVDPAPDVPQPAVTPVPSPLTELTGVDLATLVAEIERRDSGAPLRGRYGGTWRLDPAAAEPRPDAAPRVGAGVPDSAWLSADDDRDAEPDMQPPLMGRPAARWLGIGLAALSVVAVAVAILWVAGGLG